MATNFFGPMLTGLAQGLQDYQSRQEDLSYQRQQRANALAAQQLANQSQTLQIQQTQNAITQDQNQAGYLTDAAQDQQSPAQQGEQAAQGAFGGGIAPPGSLDPGESLMGARPQQQGAGQTLNALSAPVNAPPMTAPTGGLPATQNGQPTGKPMTPLQRSVVPVGIQRPGGSHVREGRHRDDANHAGHTQLTRVRRGPRSRQFTG